LHSARTTLSALKVRVRGTASSMSPSSVATMAAVLSIGLTELGHALEVLIDQLAHPALQQRRNRIAGPWR
jgi:hypothetical protein